MAVDGRACVRMAWLYALVRVPLVDTLDTDISTSSAHRQYYRYKALPMDRPGNLAQ
jgi:hypothetical protein